MSAVLEETETVPQPAEAAPASLYKYAIWVHVGVGAEECTEVDEREGVNRCGDTSHFHAWCRIPNQLQEEEIRQRALAAKARRMRQLRSPGADQNEILEAELETLAGEPDAPEQMAREIVGYDWAADYLAAVRIVQDQDDPEDEDAKLFGHIEDDQARFQRLEEMPEEDRPKDEYDELASHLAAYEKAVSEQFDAITNPKLETYRQMAKSDLLDLVRRKRVERLGHNEFMRSFSTHEWLSCTYKQPDGDPCFSDLAHLEGAPDQVLNVLSDTFADLEKTAREAQGN